MPRQRFKHLKGVAELDAEAERGQEFANIVPVWSETLTDWQFFCVYMEPDPEVLTGIAEVKGLGRATLLN